MEFQVQTLHNSNIKSLPSPKWWKTTRGRIIIAVGLVALAVGIIFWVTSRGAFSQSRVEVTIEGPTEVSAGELATYKIVYENKNEVELMNAKIIFNYPNGSVPYFNDKLINSPSSTVDVGTIGAYSKGESEFKSFMAGDKGNIRSAKAVLSFNVGGIGSVLEKSDDISTTITSLSIPLTLLAPPTAQNGQSISYILDYRNQSNEEHNNLRIKFTYPGGFKFTSATPPPTTKNDTWDIDTLVPDRGARIITTGNLSGFEGGSLPVSVVLQKRIDTSEGEKYVDFQRIESKTDIASPLLSLKLLLNNSKDYTAHLSDKLEYSLELKNNSNFNLISLGVSAKLSGTMFDFSTVETGGFFDSRTGIISWNSSAVNELGNLKPTQAIKIPFKVRLKDSFPGGFGTKDAFIKVDVSAETDIVPPELSEDRIVAEDELNTRISTSPSFTQQLKVSDSIFGSSGPFPPKVDKKTTLAIHWKIVNPANDVTGAKVTAVLPPGVFWENKSRSGESSIKPTYNSRTSTVTWNIGTLPANTGVNSSAYEGIFVVSVTPSVNQVGDPLSILGIANFSGTDSFTKEKFSINIRAIDTNDIVDFEGNGAVVR